MLVRDARVVVVTGKGGVGKTTVCSALALAAARAGRKTLLCETAGVTHVPGRFGRVGKGYEPVEVAPRLWTMSITSEAAIEDYVVQQIRFRKLYKLVFRNRVMGPFVDAVPGLHDLIQLGKVWDLERQRRAGAPVWDFLVVDAPATGHGLTMLHSPRAMMDLTVAGPFHESAGLIAALYEDAVRTAIVLVALPEELPLNETIELYEALGPLRSQVRGVVLNEVHPTPVPDRAWYDGHRDALTAAANPAGIEAIALADAALERVDRQAHARTRLARIKAPLVDLPFGPRRDLSLADLGVFASALEAL